MKWLSNFKKKFNSVKFIANKERKKIFITITTNSSKLSRKPYLTPLRKFDSFYVFGIVLFYQHEAKNVCAFIDGKIDLVFVDSEKKIPIEIEKKILKPKNKDLQAHKKKLISNEYVELGNLISVCSNNLKKSRLIEFKPNDITVNSAWMEISNHFKILNTKKIAIIGTGNIGFKLALKFVETGCNVNIYRRNLDKCMILSNAINLIKPVSTIASASFYEDKIKACLFADVIIGSSNGQSSITEKMIKVMKPKGVLLDIGKGTIEKQAIIYAKKKNIKIIRCDISSSLTNFIFEYINFKTIEKNRGRKKILKGLALVSGGFMGEDGDVVVDNFQKPSEIICIANGMGEAKKKLNKNDKINIIKLKKIISSNL